MPICAGLVGFLENQATQAGMRLTEVRSGSLLRGTDSEPPIHRLGPMGPAQLPDSGRRNG